MKRGDIFVPTTRQLWDDLGKKVQAGNHIYVFAGLHRPDPIPLIGEKSKTFARFYSVNIDSLTTADSPMTFTHKDTIICQSFAATHEEALEEFDALWTQIFDLPTYPSEDDPSCVKMAYNKEGVPTECTIQLSQSDFDTLTTSVPLYYNGL